jgi:phage gp29-like protein
MFNAISRFFGYIRGLLGGASSASPKLLLPNPGAMVDIRSKGEQGGAVSVSSEPQGVVRDEWNAEYVRLAFRRAELGDLRLVADLCDSILGDDRASAVWATRADGLLGSPLTFEPSAYSTTRQRNRAAKALEAGEDFWAMFPDAELRKLLINGRLLGVSFGRLTTERQAAHGGRAIPRLQVWSARWFRWNMTDRTWEVTDGVGNWKAITPGDGEWVVYTPFGASRPWAFGLWRGLSVLYLMKRCAILDWANQSERNGAGVWVTSGEADRKKREELASLFHDLARNASVSLSPGVTAELIESTANTYETFSAQIQTANIGMAVAAIGGNLAAEVDKNQQTGATAQNLVRVDYKRADASSLASVTHDQVLTHWAQWNFGDPRLALWPSWNVEPKEDELAEAQTWRQVGLAAKDFRDAGYELDLDETSARFGIPLKRMAAPTSAPTPPPASPPSEDATP